jgi:macrodomain Ter protein organizer (MatP/YcbG family)
MDYKSVRLRIDYWKKLRHLALELDKPIGETIGYLMKELDKKKLL